MANLPYVSANSNKVLGIMKMYSRMGAYPLDATSVFNTKADLESYINEAGSYAYAGQVVAVANGTIAAANGAKNYSLYVIRSDKSVQEIGKNLVFESVEAAQLYATENAAAYRAGEILTVYNSTTSKYVLYTYMADGALQKLSFDATTDLPSMEWSSILNKPTSAVADIDSSVAFVKENLAKNAAGDHLTFGGKDVALSEDLKWANIEGKPDTFTPSAHTHGKDDITSVDAGVIQGVISIENLPHGAMERCVVVADDDARFALTTEQVQSGDTVKVTATNTMYFVKDDTKLAEEAGYEVYTAGAATEVPWSGVTGKPTTVAGYGITDVYNKTESDERFAAKVHGHVYTDIDNGSGVKLDAELANIKNGSSITSLDASVLTGTIAPERLPATALNKVVTVASDSERFALTADAVSKDDTVRVTSTGNMYLVVDVENLSTDAGYAIYTGNATSVAWINVSGKPTTLAGYGITDAVNSSEVVAAAEPNKLLKLDSNSKLPASITGDADTVDGKHASDFAPAVHQHTESDITGTISWSKLASTPTTLAGYGITDAVNSSEVVAVAEPNKLLKLNSDSKLPASITGDADTVDGKHASDFAAAVHGHAIAEVEGLSDELTNIKNGSSITSLDAGVLTGTISVDRLPHGALERCVVVADDTARFALTVEQVQTGDTVKVQSSNKMYFVKDDTKLAEEAGYEVYTAGAATEVPWSGVTGKPTTVAGYGITDVYTQTESDNRFINKDQATETPESGKLLKVNADGKLPASITGEAGSVAWANITNKPTSTVEQIDAAVTAATHTNRAQLDKVSETAEGQMTYNNNEVAYKTDLTSILAVSETEPANLPVGGLWFDTSNT